MGENVVPVLILVGIGCLYNALHYARWFEKIISKKSALTILLADYITLFALVLLTGGINSPYFFYLALPLVIAAYWYSQSAVFGIALLSLGSGIVASILSTGIQMEISPIQQAIGYIATLCMLALLVSRLTVSERTQRRFALKAHDLAVADRARLLSLINSMADAVIATDKDGIISDYNSSALDLLNTNTALKGTLITKLIDFRLGDKHFNILHQAFKQRTILKRDDLHFVNNSGETIKLYVSASRIVPAESGGPEGLIFLLRDITKEKSVEEQRDEFIAVASHELRTPLAIAEANISTALMPQFKEKLDPQMEPLLTHAHENIVFLGNLVKDLTTLAEAEKDVLDVNLSVVDGAQLVHQLVEDYRPQAKEKGLQLRTTIQANLPPVVTSEQHVREILQNFLTNALKYTEQGTITVSVDSSPEAPDNLVFAVQDTGIGISSSDQKHLFGKFYRSEDYRTRETGGSGLGLYITEKLAHRLNAHISFESQLNKGSTFYLRVPPFSRLKRDQKKILDVQVDNIISSL